jgi:hypothetical protein
VESNRIITEFQVEKYFEAIKQIGTANSAGLFGGLISLYYFKDLQPQVLEAIRLATGIYIAGVMVFGIAYAIFMVFIYSHQPMTIPTKDTVNSFEDGPLFRSAAWATVVCFVLWLAGAFATIRILPLM